MRSLFTIHAGEFVVGEYIQKNFRRLNLWVPARDTGIDLLVTDSKNKKRSHFRLSFERFPAGKAFYFTKVIKGLWLVVFEP